MKYIIEVGANNGDSTVDFVNSGCIVYAFEPTPRFITDLKQRFINNNNFNLVNAAVDVTDGKAIFNIAGSDKGDWGCSSLNQFTDNVHNLWPDSGRTREDLQSIFSFTESVEVNTMRLDTFMNMMAIDEVEWLHIDAQGSDFNVLKSLGERWRFVRAGQVEATMNLSLYKNVNNNFNEISTWLDERGFKIDMVRPVDSNHNEVDVMFSRK